MEKVVSRGKKMRFEGPRFTFSPWKNLGETWTRSYGDGKVYRRWRGSSRTKENARFLFSFHTPRENGRSSALIRFLFEEPRFDRRAEAALAKGMVFPARENDPNLLQLLLRVCWNFPSVIVKLPRYNPFRLIFINESTASLVTINVKNRFEIVSKSCVNY